MHWPVEGRYHIACLGKRKLILVIVAAALLSGAAEAREPRDRKWLIQYVTQPIPQTPRNRRYLDHINRYLDDKYLGLDLNFLEDGGGNHSRAQTNTLGRLAFCYHTRGLKYYQDAQLLERLRRAYLAVTKHVGTDGFMAWSGDRDYFYRAHEQAWRLEPLLLGYIWAGKAFPKADRQIIEAALARAAQWLVHDPMDQTNNRGAVWCAVSTLCGLYFERPDYLKQVESYADRIMNGVVLEDGEVGEHALQTGGGGPDSNYSYTGWAYVYLYRLLSGKSEMDDRLLRAMRWFSFYNTLHGFPTVTGASVRTGGVNRASLQDILPGLERFSRREPFFATLAENILNKKEKFSPGFGGHLISPLIWAMLEDGVKARSGPAPDWYANHLQIHEREKVQYAMIGRSYQTGVVFRAWRWDGDASPLRGMQTFAFGDEYPILLHTDSAHSTTLADDIDTAAMDVDQGPRGWEVFLTNGPGLATLAERRKTLWTLYAFTPPSVVIVYGGARGQITSRWVMNRAAVSRPSLDAAARSLSFEGRKGRIYYLAGKAKLFSPPQQKDAADVLEVISGPPVSAFAFSDGSFRFGRYDQDLYFSDSSGRYRLGFAHVLSEDGALNRNAPLRLAAQ